jgi:hypothetical protein
VIPDTLDHMTQGDLQMYDPIPLDHMFGLSCATHMRALLRLSLHVEILIIGSTRLSLRNLESP